MVVWQESGVAKCDPASVKELVQVPLTCPEEEVWSGGTQPMSLPVP